MFKSLEIVYCLFLTAAEEIEDIENIGAHHGHG